MPPSVEGRTSAAAASQSRSASSPARRSGRLSSAHPSSSSAAPYPEPPSTRGSAPGVEITSEGSSGTVASTASRPEVRTGIRGNALPSSSAVRRAPTTWARSRNDPHSGQCQSFSVSPHHPHVSRASAEGASSGPSHRRHRAGVRQRPQASRGT